jgi:hypothetical protein
MPLFLSTRAFAHQNNANLPNQIRNDILDVLISIERLCLPGPKQFVFAKLFVQTSPFFTR